MSQQKKNKKTGIFLMHGVTKSREELLPLKEALEEAGYYVETPNLPRHGLCPREYKTCWRDVLQLTPGELLKGATEEFLNFRKKVGDVFVGGNSLGANLAFHLANEYPVKGIIAMAPIYQLSRSLELLLSIKPKIQFLLPESSKKDSDKLVFHNFNITTVVDLIDLVKESPDYVKGLSIPTLLIFSKHEDIASPKNASFFIKWLKNCSDVYWIDKGGHGILSNPEIIPIIKDFCTDVQKNL